MKDNIYKNNQTHIVPFGFTLIFRSVLLLIFSWTLLPSCDWAVPDEAPSWSPEVLVPLIKSSASTEDLAEIEDFQFRVDIPSIDIDYASGETFDVPPLNINFLGPYIFEISEYIKSMEAVSIELDFAFYNAFPIDIGAGTKVVLRRSADTTSESNIIESHTIATPISAGTTYYFTIIVENELVTSNVYLFVEDFTSPGGEDVTFTNEPSTLIVDFESISIGRVLYNTNEEYESSDTVEFSISDETDIDQDDVTGLLTSYFKNQLPLNMEFQLYFMDANGITIIDSLYETKLFLDGALTDAAGNVIEEVEYENTIILDGEKWALLKSSAYVIFDFKVDTYGYPGEVVASVNENTFNLLVVGDLKVHINP